MKMKKICAALLFAFAAIIAGNLLYRTVFAENDAIRGNGARSGL